LTNTTTVKAKKWFSPAGTVQQVVSAKLKTPHPATAQHEGAAVKIKGTLTPGMLKNSEAQTFEL